MKVVGGIRDEFQVEGTLTLHQLPSKVSSESCSDTVSYSATLAWLRRNEDAHVNLDVTANNILSLRASYGAIAVANNAYRVTVRLLPSMFLLSARVRTSSTSCCDETLILYMLPVHV